MPNPRRWGFDVSMFDSSSSHPPVDPPRTAAMAVEEPAEGKIDILWVRDEAAAAGPARVRLNAPPPPSAEFSSGADSRRQSLTALAPRWAHSSRKGSEVSAPEDGDGDADGRRRRGGDHAAAAAPGGEGTPRRS
mmetsp:Transcript_59039/g.175547  ORF Transcript_59039/g.175547 Transcript_59039/m.175547 type:complete len:134 (+) Transcript_59039:466-867(+)